MANHDLSPLPYANNALEPWIDEQTMRVHHDKHHQAYRDNFVKAIAGTDFEGLEVSETLAQLDRVPEAIRTAVRNHGGGFASHNLFWQVMGPNAGGVPTGSLAEAISRSFGSFETFKEKFSAAAMGQFGSGWAWLVINSKGELALYNLPNQENPVTKGDTPILNLDVWEHAYYLKYQNRRAEYVQNWWHVANWTKVGELFALAKK